MPEVVREDIDGLHAVLTVIIEKTEYEPKFNEELKKFQGKAHMKGFRKGKTPISFLKKKYGKGVLSEIINKMLQEKVAAFLKNDESSFLGQPIPAEGQDPIEFNTRALEDYVFRFDVGVPPEFEVVGVSEEDEYEQYLVEISDEQVGKELDYLRKNYGERVLSEEKIEKNDLVKLKVKELEGDSLKEEGRESVFSLSLDDKIKEEVKKEILSKKVGDTLRLNLFELGEYEDEKIAKKFYLEMTKEEIEEGVEAGPFFEATIEEASRMVPAELNQEFFDKIFGKGTISTEEEFKEAFRKNLADQYEKQTESLLFSDLHKTIKEKTAEAIPLPDDFLKRWLKLSDSKNTDELLEKNFSNYAAQLRWSLISAKLVKQFNLQVSQEEVLGYFRTQIFNYFVSSGINDGDLFNDTMERMMKDKKEVEKAANKIVADKMFLAIKEAVTIRRQPVSVEEFDKIIEALQKEDAPPAELEASGKNSGEKEE